jgi:subtilisin-like proprotein convertase family protein
MNGRSMNFAAFLAAAAALSAAAAAQVVNPESEPNDAKAQATAAASGGAGMAPGDSISGTSTGATTTPGPDSADYFRVKTAAAALGIYRHQLILDTTANAAAIVGLQQINGTVTTAQALLQTARADGSVSILQWYGFGKQEELFVSVTGTPTSTSPYAATLQRTPVTPVDVTGVITNGTVTIQPGPGNTADTDFWVYDANLNPIAGFGHDDANASGLTRTFAAGTYYLAISDYNFANNLASPADDVFRTGPVLDLPNAALCSGPFAIADMSVSFTSSIGTVSAAAPKASPFDVVWYRFFVQPPPNPSGVGSVNPASVPQGSTTLFTVAVTPGFGPPPSTGLGVTANLTNIGGPSPALFYDDATHGDVTAGDNIFSLLTAVSGLTSPGDKSLPWTVTDAQGRSGSGSFSLTVTAAPTGSCCTAGNCTIVNQATCEGGGGVYNGNGTNCQLPDTSFPSADAPRPIPDGQPAGTALNVTVPAGSGTVSNLVVRLGLMHTWVGDLTCTLRGPSGTVVTLFARVGRAGTGFGTNSDLSGTYRFYDSAQGNFWTAAAGNSLLPPGDYKPSRALDGLLPSPSLAAFNGLPFEGNWTLIISDSTTTDVGSVTSFAIESLSSHSACGTPCGSPDFDGDGDVATDADIEAFFACLAGTCCPTCGSADFDGDGDVATDADIEAFFRVLAGGEC